MPKKLTEVQIEELLEDYADGYSVNDCSVIYRVSIRTVYRILAEYNAKGPKRRRKPGPRKKKPPPRELKPCGTEAAYRRHKRKKEYPCTACLAAHVVTTASYKEKS